MTLKLKNRVFRYTTSVRSDMIGTYNVMKYNVEKKYYFEKGFY